MLKITFTYCKTRKSGAQNITFDQLAYIFPPIWYRLFQDTHIVNLFKIDLESERLEDSVFIFIGKSLQNIQQDKIFDLINKQNISFISS